MIKKILKKRIKKIKWIPMFLILSLLLIIPTPAFAADGDKWYMKPFEWMIGTFFKYILSPFLGIHEPAYYIFYQGDGLIWGMFSQEQFDNAIKNGFNMMLFAVSFMLVTSIIKMGVSNAYGKFSSSMKVDLMDNGIKLVIALLLLFNFFSIINTFFTINMYGVSLFEAGISEPNSLTDLGATILTSADGTKTPGDEISFTDLDNGSTNPIKNAIVSFFSLGVAIWFKAYYIQRMFTVSGLIILAPIWISTMFFPKLQGITGTAFKELWAQILSQVIHSATFYLYYWLFDSSQDWFTYIIALSIFIPVSESIRFALGATSENAGKLAMVGTLAGAGAIQHMGKAAGDIKNGFKNSFMERKGSFDGSQGSSANGSSNVSSSMGFQKEGKDRQYGGTANLNASPNKFARNMRSFGHVAAGFGSAMMRTAGYSAGMGINPIAGQFAAEGGAAMGKNAGYSAGTVSYAGGKAIQGKSRNAIQGFKGNYQNSREQGQNRFQATMSGMGGGIAEGTVSSEFRNNPIRRNEIMQKAGGAIGEATYGRGVGYHMGSEAATKFAAKGVQDKELARLNPKKQYAVVTSNKGSYLAEKGSNSQLTPISNMKAGDSSLPDGEMVIQEYAINQNSSNGNIRKFEANSPQYAIKNVPKDGGRKWQKVKVEQPAQQPNIQDFLNKKTTPLKNSENL